MKHLPTAVHLPPPTHLSNIEAEDNSTNHGSILGKLVCCAVPEPVDLSEVEGFEPLVVTHCFERPRYSTAYLQRVHLIYGERDIKICCAEQSEQPLVKVPYVWFSDPARFAAKSKRLERLQQLYNERSNAEIRELINKSKAAAVPKEWSWDDLLASDENKSLRDLVDAVFDEVMMLTVDSIPESKSDSGKRKVKDHPGFDVQSCWLRRVPQVSYTMRGTPVVTGYELRYVPCSRSLRIPVYERDLRTAHAEGSLAVTPRKVIHPIDETVRPVVKEPVPVALGFNAVIGPRNGRSKGRR